MSTKTSFKRIALVAASALAIAGFSAVPAFAALVTTVTVDAGTGSTIAGAATGAVGTPVTFQAQVALGTPANGSTTIVTPALTGTATVLSAITVSSGLTVAKTNGSTMTAAAPSASGVVTFTSTGAASTDGLIDYTFTPDTAGTYIFTLTNTVTGAGAATVNSTVTYTYTATAIAGTPTLPVWINAATTLVPTDDLVTAVAAGQTGISYTKGIITGSVTALTVPIGTAVTFGIKASGSTFRTSDILDFSLNGTVVQSANADVALTTNNTVYTFAKAGTFAGVIRYYATAGTRVSATATFNLPFTIIVTTASAFSAPLSSALIRGDNTAAVATTTTDALAVSGTAVNTGTSHVAALTISLFDAKGVAMANGDSALTLNASIAGPGYLNFVPADDAVVANKCLQSPTFAATLGRSIAPTTVDAVGTLYVCADGNAGVATVTVSITNGDGVTAQVGSVKTVTFFGAATALSVHAANYTIGKSGGAITGATAASSTTTPAIVIKQVDKVGALSSYATPTVVSSDVTVVASGTCVLDLADATYGYGAAGYYDCSFTTASSAKSGDKATLTFRILDPAGDGTTYLTTTQAVTVGGSVATETLSFDATSYVAGAPMVITRTAKDSSGNPVYDGASVPAVSFTKAVGGTAPAASTNGANKGGYVGGKKATSSTSPSVFAPAVSGDFSAYMTSGNTAATTLTAASSVAADTAASDASALALDAANAATDAANNAYDEAQNATQAASDALAAVTALAAQVESLIASIKMLTAAVAKMAKKK